MVTFIGNQNKQIIKEEADNQYIEMPAVPVASDHRGYSNMDGPRQALAMALASLFLISSSYAQERLIQSLSTDLQFFSGDEYHLYETDEAVFSVNVSYDAIITWTVDGKKVSEEYANSSVLRWTPGIEFTDDIRTVEVAAHVGEETRSITVNVENVIDAYLSISEDSESSAIVNIITNDKKLRFDRLQATLEGSEDNKVSYRTVALGPEEANGTTAWTALVEDMKHGKSFLTGIIGYSEGKVRRFDFEVQPSFQRGEDDMADAPADDIPRADSSSSYYNSGTPRLVHAFFQRDLLDINGTQTITLDAKNFNGGVVAAQALVLTPSGKYRKIELSLKDGSKEYGTWEGSFKDLEPGNYRLYSVDLHNQIGPTRTFVDETGFYVKAIEDVIDADLDLVYALLDKSKVENGTIVGIGIDAVDRYGVGSATANIVSNRGDELAVGLELTKGDQNYGSWEGSFTVETPDATYSIRSIELANNRTTRIHEVTGRQVYVIPMPAQASDLSVAEPLTLEGLIRKPLVPTRRGFGLMAVSRFVMVRFNRDPVRE